MTTSDIFDHETIFELTSQLWSAVVPEVSSLEPSPDAASLLGAGPSLTGRIEIGGSWAGTVELTCSLAAARRLAAAMFGVPEPDLDELAVPDAVGELVNIVGGNLKSLLPPPTSLSLPAVEEQVGRAGPGRQGSGFEAGFSWLGEPVLVELRPGGSALAAT